MGRKNKLGGPDGPDDAPPAPPDAAAGLAGLLAANPLLVAANPLLAVALASNPGLLGAPRPAASAEPEPSPPSNMIDPDVQELCDYFHIEERHARRLSEIMKKRQDTFVEDLERLYDVLDRANSPAGLLVVKMREMEEGTFVGKVKPDKELLALSKKFKLDDQAESKLADILARYDGAKRREYLADLEKHMEVSNRPSAMAMLLLRKLGEGQPLGKPGPPAPGSMLDKALKEQRGGGSRDDRDRRGDDRSRDDRGRDDRGRENRARDERSRDDRGRGDRDRRSRSRRRD